MTMNIYKKTIVLFIFSGILASCQKEYFEKPKLDLSIPVSFSVDLQPILTAKCAGSGCHDKSYPPKLLIGEAYTSLIEGGYIDTLVPAQSSLMGRLNKDMPKSKLPPAEINKFLTWITQGAKDN